MGHNCMHRRNGRTRPCSPERCVSSWPRPTRRAWYNYIGRYYIDSHGLCSHGPNSYGLDRPVMWYNFIDPNYILKAHTVMAYGLYSCGIYSCCLRSYGLCRYGLYSYSLYSYGPYSCGLYGYGLTHRVWRVDPYNHFHTRASANTCLYRSAECLCSCWYVSLHQLICHN